MTYFPSPPPDAMLMSGIQVVSFAVVFWDVTQCFSKPFILGGALRDIPTAAKETSIQVIFGRLNIACGKGGQKKWFTKTFPPFFKEEDSEFI